MKKTTSKLSTATKVEIGAGLLAAAAAGYYFYGSKEAKGHRKSVEKWVNDLPKIDQAKVIRVAREVKQNWEKIQKEAARKEVATKSAVKVVKKAVATGVKKVRAA